MKAPHSCSFFLVTSAFANQLFENFMLNTRTTLGVQFDEF